MDSASSAERIVAYNSIQAQRARDADAYASDAGSDLLDARARAMEEAKRRYEAELAAIERATGAEDLK